MCCLNFREANWRQVICFVVLLIALVSVLNNCNSPNPETKQLNSEQQQTAGSSATHASTNPRDTDLTQEINTLIDEGELSAARWGVSVVALSDRRIVFERDSDRLFTPASNMKLFPTSVALELLGGDYRWRTSIYSISAPDAAGTINGDLVLYGRGAPDLVVAANKDDANNNSLEELATQIYNRGVRRINGNVIGDESYFRGDAVGNGWQWNDLQWYFGAEASALSINNNETSVNVLPPEKSATAPVVRVADSSGYITVENRMASGKAGERMTVGIQRGLSDNVIRVWGTFPPGSKGFGARLSVHHPALWATKLFVEQLKARGVVVNGEAQTRDSRVPIAERFDPQRARELASVSSKPLSEIIKITNKFSVNLYAELILRTLGRERAAMLSAPEPSGREAGDDENGLAVIRTWLNRSGVTTPGLALHDGSGLSRLNLVTPRSISQLLTTMYRGGNGQVFRDSLPQSGRDGTLTFRLKEYQDRVSAKTGYLTYTTSLSGYVNTSGGEVFAFSIICNDETARASSGRLIDQIVSLLASYPHKTTQKAP